jgi:hypothetical protein
MIKPVCPHCNSRHYTKQSWYIIKPKFDNNQRVKLYLQRYKHENFTIIKTFRNLTELKNIFHIYDYKTCLKKFENLLSKTKDFIPVLFNCISDKLIFNF